MQGDPEVIEFLNEQLTAELTAINQYFLHAKMQENFGWTKLAKYTRSESIDEMKHAEMLTDRILFLEGLPNYQRLFHVRVGQTVTEMFQADRQVEVEAIDRLRRGIEVMRAKGDVTSANIFESILADEEHHIDYLDTQLELVEKLGEPLYIAQLIEQPEQLSRAGGRGRSGGLGRRSAGSRRIRHRAGGRQPGRLGRRRSSSSRRGPRPSRAWMRRTQEPQSVPALQAEAICARSAGAGVRVLLHLLPR